jgi:alkanesulfonate monooxygenase SsuD/methylene tetrahydromethanopterin reductase-like flavin-dependent oxidoreductase (luciferase family)
MEKAKQYKLDAKEENAVLNMKEKMVIGNPQLVKQKLETLQATYKADEIMIVTITHSSIDRIQSYRLIAEEML